MSITTLVIKSFTTTMHERRDEIERKREREREGMM
jgi:hypothetical protein